MSLSLHRNKTHKTVAEILRILAALLLAGSCFATLVSELQLSFRLDELFSGGVISGLSAVWDHIAQVLGNTTYTILPVYQGAGESYGLFLLLTLVILAVGAYLVVRSRFAPLVLLFVLPQLLLALLFPLQPAPAFCILNAASVIFALIVMKNPDGLFKALLGTLLPALAAVILLFAIGTDSVILKGPNTGLSAIGEKAADLLYGKDDLGHGDLSVRERSVREGEALSVTMSNPQSMYLKGFTGSVFNGNQWTALSDASYYQAKDLMDALEKEGFYAPGGLAKTAEIAYGKQEGEEADTENEIAIQNTGADSRIVYVPYDITDSGTLTDLQTKGGADYAPGYLKSAKSYRFTAAENQVDNWTDAAARFFTIAIGGGKEDGKKADGESGTIKDASFAERKTAAADLLRLESHFNTFVYDNYTQLSNTERKLLAENIGSSGNQRKGHMDYKLAIDTIRSYLEEEFIYTEDLGTKTSSSVSAVEDFFTSHKGFDVQYATAATLMFRYYGIPARYVEGFLITPEDAKGAAPGQALSVGRERAHAWCEIYVDGIGFVPLEVTPEFYGMMEEADMSIGISNKALMQEFEDQFGGQSAAEEEPEPPEENKEGDSILSLIYLVLAVILGIGVLFVLILLLRMLFRSLQKASARRKLFYKSDPKTAVAAIYGYMEEQKLKPDAETVALGNLAAYSRRSIPEESREKMLSALKKLKKEKSAGR